MNTLEFSYIQDLENFQLGVTYYKNEINNLIVLGAPIVDDNNPLEAPSFVNSGKFETSGIEAELKYSPFEQLQLRGTLSVDLDSRVLLTPPTMASFYVNYNIGNFNINLNGYYRDEMEFVVGQKSYTVINAKLWYAFTKEFRIYFGGCNIFDTEYRTISSIFTDGVPNRGRTFRVGLNYRL
ncbi:MAG: TonB-dependent receptor [Chloroflexia bacterium]|nr:TonB-dependent receptor [Chloroflexia bacterium]